MAERRRATLSAGEAARAGDARALNLRTALQAISSAEGMSRAGIARMTGLTRATVSSLVAELIEDGLVVEDGTGESRGGKPPTLLALAPGGRDIVAVDLSAQPFRGTRVDLAGTVRASLAGDPGRVTGDDAVAEVRRLVEALLAVDGAPVAGIGIATPGLVDEEGMVHEAPNLGWHDRPLGEELADLDAPVWVANDADVAAMAEFAVLPEGADDVVLVRLADGVGAGVVLGGQLWRGARAAAGEIGHLVVVEDGAPCPCGLRGCLETIASTPAILGAAVDHPDGLPGATADAGRHLGRVLAHLVAVLDVADVVLACELEGIGDALVTAVERELTARLLPAQAAHVRVRMSTHDADQVLAGAAALVAHEALGLAGR